MNELPNNFFENQHVENQMKKQKKTTDSGFYRLIIFGKND